MGLFGKKKTPEEILSEGRAQYVKGDLKKSFITLHGLAAKGNPQACYYIGRIYLERKEKNLAQSFLITAAKGGVQDAASLLAKEFGVRDYLPKETASEEDITADKAFARGFDAYNGKNYAEALKWWERAAQLGEPAAQYNLGYMYHAGEGTDKNENKAFYWYRKSAEGGHPSGQYNTGVYYLYGVETAVNKEEALKWFRLAAEQGDENAKKQLAALTPKPELKPEPKPEPAQKSGEELSPDEQYQKGMELFKAGRYEEAYKFLDAVCDIFYFSRQKAENIYPAGQAALGWMCETGNGTKLDATAASMYYGNAIDNATGVPDRDGMAGMVRLTAKAENPSLQDCEAALDYVKQLGTSEAKAAVPALEKKLDKAQRHEKIDAMIRDYDRLSASEKDRLADKWLSMTMPQKFAFKKALGEALEKQAECIDDLETQRKIKEIAYECQHYKERYEFAMNNFKGVSDRKEQIQWIEELFGRPLSSEELKATNLENLFREAFFWRG